MPSNVKVSSSWKTVAALHTRVGGSWKNVVEGYTRIGGAWKAFFTSNALVVDHLVIAGGGGGGGRLGGGGGGGGYRTSAGTSGGGASAESRASVSVATNYTVTVGGGGAGGTNAVDGSNGGNSVFATITSTGGGGGKGENSNTNGLAGGSGGGGSIKAAFTGTSFGGAGTANQGFAGGNSIQASGVFGGAAGGGGAGGVGQDVSASVPNSNFGGLGVVSTITGASVSRGGGGGGGATGATGNGGGGRGSIDPSTAAVAGTANTGGGGGGGNYQNVLIGGAGGSGVVILKYPSNYAINPSPGLSHRTVTSAGFNITTFTAGTGTVSFAAATTSSYELIQTVYLTASQSSITFDVSGISSDYQHLQIRLTGRASRSGATTDPLIMQLNGATQTYGHHLYGNGSSVGSGSIATSYSILDAITGATATANAFGACVIDILDPFETTKNKTIKAFSGANTVVGLSSTFWNSTSAVTSITLSAFSATSFLTGSRFSIYGLKGS